MDNKLLCSLFCICGLFFLTSCASSAPRLAQPIERTRTFNASYDEVWSSAIQAFSTQNQMVTLSEKDSGVIGVENHLTAPNVWEYVLIDGWSKFWTTWTGFVTKINLLVKPEEDQTKTKVNVNIQILGNYNQAQPNYFTGAVSYTAASILLNSNGKLEKEYLDKIEAQLPQDRKLSWLNEKEPAAAPASTAASTASLAGKSSLAAETKAPQTSQPTANTAFAPTVQKWKKMDYSKLPAVSTPVEIKLTSGKVISGKFLGAAADTVTLQNSTSEIENILKRKIYAMRQI